MTLELLRQARTRGYSFECLSKPFHPIEVITRALTHAGSCTNTDEARLTDRINGV